MKKIFAICMTFVMLISFTGCKSHLRPTLENEWAKANVQEFDFNTCFDEENGYHYPGMTWGMGLGDVMTATYNGLGKVVGYTEEVTVYEADGVKIMVDGRKNSEATAAFHGEDCYMISVLYDDKDLSGLGITQSEYYDKFYEKIAAVYGEPADEEESEVNSNNTVTKYTTCHWYYTTPDGKDTEMQLAKARISYQEEPSYISFGFVWQKEEIREAEEADNAE